MAQVAKSGTPSLCTPSPPSNCRISGLLAGEAIAAGDLLYLKSDGKLWLANGTSANAAAKVVGMAAQAASVGEAVTAYYDVHFRYGSGMTPGALLYLSATAGTIADGATTGGTKPIGRVISDTVIEVWQTREA